MNRNEGSNVFYGKYRGVVTDNKDPSKLGRVRAKVPDVYGDLESGWAMPAAPFGGKGLGFFALPDEGAGVWVEFECGDPDYPIWTGCWWGSSSEMPSELSSDPELKVLIKTKGGHSILLDDSSGKGITIKTSDGQMIELNSQGIEIKVGTNASDANVKLGGQKVSLNGNALEVE